ncbi:MAG: hypothetical protein RLY47_331 [Candidatus Parcubacteria bacterium]|jgi:hypothetical protein
MKFLKGLSIALVVLGDLGLLMSWFQTFFVGQYYVSAPIYLTILFGAVWPIVLVWGGYQLIRAILRAEVPSRSAGLGVGLVLALCGIGTSGCARSHANVQTLVTSDCGVDWELVQPGKVLPAMIGPCSYKVTVPDYPMQGETRFKTSFKDRVIAGVEIPYEYIIFDAMKFIGEAKYLGKENSDAQDQSNSSSAYESAENTVIDKRLRDVVTGLLIKEDIIDFSQAEFEDRLLEEVNKRLEDKGVRLNFLSFVPTPEDQTRLAIDMMTAMKVYESRGLASLGQQVSVARAGATKITVTTAENKE